MAPGLVCLCIAHGPFHKSGSHQVHEGDGDEKNDEGEVHHEDRLGLYKRCIERGGAVHGDELAKGEESKTKAAEVELHDVCGARVALQVLDGFAYYAYPDPWADQKSRSRSIRAQNGGIYFLDPPGSPGSK